jgi:hypothetical protein
VQLGAPILIPGCNTIVNGQVHPVLGEPDRQLSDLESGALGYFGVRIYWRYFWNFPRRFIALNGKKCTQVHVTKVADKSW